ncbi:MAG: hypothetical protein E6K18_03400 [Methanobacteriota archaeon]|nr:MAG: hypothetical protein E6K18_03400 [Euryarchaeota archaeon]
MNPLGVLGLILLLSLLGTVAGLATGLVPGIHVNNVALLVLAASPAILGSLEASVGGEGVLLLAAFLVAASAAHGMSSLLPSVFLGAPDEDTALSVLPGHRLLVQGRGYEAVLLAARGALLATFLAIPMLLPFRLLLGSPVNGYAKLRPVLPLVLLLLVVLLVAMEGRSSEEPSRRLRKRAWAVGLLLLAGLLGWIVLRPGVLEDAWVPVPVAGGSLILFPLFTGLFGLPTLLMAARTRGRLPPQILGPADPLPDWRRTRAVLSGTLAGAAVSWFPGLGGSNATVVAQLLAGGEPQEDPDADREFLLAAGAASASSRSRRCS